MRRPVSPWAKAEIAGYIVGKDGLDTPCPYNDGPLADAWHEGRARGQARAETLKIEVLP